MIYHGGRSYDLSDLPEVVRTTTANLRPHVKKFDCIVCSGMSGVIVAIPVGLRLRKPVVIVRKKSDNSHSSTPHINGAALKGKRALFLDDFVASGATKTFVKSHTVKEGATMIAQYTYREHNFTPLVERTS